MHELCEVWVMLLIVDHVKISRFRGWVQKTAKPIDKIRRKGRNCDM